MLSECGPFGLRGHIVGVAGHWRVCRIAAGVPLAGLAAEADRAGGALADGGVAHGLCGREEH